MDSKTWQCCFGLHVRTATVMIGMWHLVSVRTRRTGDGRNIDPQCGWVVYCCVCVFVHDIVLIT